MRRLDIDRNDANTGMLSPILTMRENATRIKKKLAISVLRGREKAAEQSVKVNS